MCLSPSRLRQHKAAGKHGSLNALEADDWDFIRSLNDKRRKGLVQRGSMLELEMRQALTELAICLLELVDLLSGLEPPLFSLRVAQRGRHQLRRNTLYLGRHFKQRLIRRLLRTDASARRGLAVGQICSGQAVTYMLQFAFHRSFLFCHLL